MTTIKTTCRLCGRTTTQVRFVTIERKVIDQSGRLYPFVARGQAYRPRLNLRELEHLPAGRWPICTARQACTRRSGLTYQPAGRDADG